VERYLNREITGDTLAACTARSYQAVARRLAWRDVNYADSVLLAGKAQAAQAGQPPTLFEPGFRARSPDRAAALADGRNAALRALSTADADACQCGGIAGAYDDWALSALAGDWDGAKGRFAVALSACPPRP
jgi:hypothetical protein